MLNKSPNKSKYFLEHLRILFLLSSSNSLIFCLVRGIILLIVCIHPLLNAGCLNRFSIAFIPVFAPFSDAYGVKPHPPSVDPLRP